MKKIFLITVLSSFLSVSAFADTSFFVGGGLGLGMPIFSDVLDNQIEDGFWNDDSGSVDLMLLAGVRFGAHDSIYNGGVSANLSYMPDLGKLTDGAANPYYMSAEIDLTRFYISYDNYIRLSGSDSKYRTDFVASIGLGYAWVEENLDVPSIMYEYYKDSGLLLDFKFGFGGETVVEGLGWFATFDVFALNAEEDADLQGGVGFDVGVKYTF